MRRVRTRHTSRFTVVPNDLAQHTDLSLRARGLGLLLLSLPDGADISIRGLATRLNEGETVIARALRELETVGYLTRRVVRLTDGRVVTRTTVRDVPATEDEQSPDQGASHTTHEPPAAAPEAAPEPKPDAATPSTPSAEPTAPAPRTTRPPAQPLAPAALTAGTRLLIDLAAREPRLTVTAAALPDLAALCEQALSANVDPAEIHRVLAACLPVEIRSPAALIRHRLAEHLPVWRAAASLRALRAAHAPAPSGGLRLDAAPGRARFVECGDCGRPLRTATGDGLCGDCRVHCAA
ncbi:helix-turn-helix domain-containing protein [Actinomadura harenae]|uniref:Helix-turn-helix domain-containing protein n=1 Tax=Actinomadura harenae TaxID=2483351 RepID=A0A3M2LNG7_9ACTN|nr:helix-turn-helix domain-containing protein [Actinomadura harenae]RMI38987.1 helix-turn-helix domain-containing protein [Actinomadura harenae]